MNTEDLCIVPDKVSHTEKVYTISNSCYPHAFLKKAKGILFLPPSVCPSVMLSPPKPLDEIKPNLVVELLT